MDSITNWTRLEPSTRSGDLRTTLQAKVHDPLWLLARQWQLGEFQGEDAGSPVVARIRAECAPLTRYHPGPLIKGKSTIGQPYDPRHVPLETLVEREGIRSKNDPRSNWRLASEAGLYFLRLLTANGLNRYRKDYVANYMLQPPSEEDKHTADGDSLRFLSVMARRVPNGIRLYQDLSDTLRRQPAELPEHPKITGADRREVIKTAEIWLKWYEALFSEPDGGLSPWISDRMEYSFAVSAPTSDGEIVLTAPEYQEGHLDWYSFNLYPGGSLGVSEKDAKPKEVVRTVIPAPVGYKGMPADRWWEFEDAQVDFGAVETSPEDLSRMLLIKFALSYGNDWFMMPVDLEVGAIYRIRSLVITDTFGERTLIRPYSQVDGTNSDWRMFCPCLDWRKGAKQDKAPESIFFLPPVLLNSLHSSPVEKISFLRDEMANMAWAVEHLVESSIGAPLDRYEAYQENRNQGNEGGIDGAGDSASSTSLVYRLNTKVPDNWIPLLPVRKNKNSPSVRLQRGGLLLDRSGEPVVPKPQGRVLEPDPLSIFEEEVPRAGARVTRVYQYARWIDGSNHLWIGRRKQPGRGEGWSGLRFDVVEVR